MAITLIVLLGLLLLCFVVFKIGNTFSPWTMTVGIWLAILILIQLTEDLLDPLHDRFYTCVLIWVPIMCVSCLLTYYALPSKKYDIASSDLEINKIVYNTLFTISMVFSPVYLYQMLEVVMMFNTEDLVENLRVLANSGEGPALFAILKYVNAINQVLFIVELWHYPNGNKWRFLAVIMANLMCTFAVMAKFPLFFMIFATLFILYEKKRIRIWTIATWIIIIIVAFYFINEIRSTDDSEEGTDFIDFFLIYIVSPAPALEQTQERVTEQFGTYTFSFFYAILSKLGLGTYYVEKQLQPFVWVPVPTNVYSVFQPFLEDFGYKGVAFFANVYGIFTGWIYRHFRNGSPLARCLYTYICVILIMQFFQEYLFLNLSVLIQYTVLLWLLVQKDISIKFIKSKS